MIQIPMFKTEFDTTRDHSCILCRVALRKMWTIRRRRHTAVDTLETRRWRRRLRCEIAGTIRKKFSRFIPRQRICNIRGNVPQIPFCVQHGHWLVIYIDRMKYRPIRFRISVPTERYTVPKVRPVEYVRWPRILLRHRDVMLEIVHTSRARVILAEGAEANSLPGATPRAYHTLDGASPPFDLHILDRAAPVGCRCGNEYDEARLGKHRRPILLEPYLDSHTMLHRGRSVFPYDGCVCHTGKGGRKQYSLRPLERYEPDQLRIDACDTKHVIMTGRAMNGKG